MTAPAYPWGRPVRVPAPRPRRAPSPARARAALAPQAARVARATGSAPLVPYLLLLGSLLGIGLLGSLLVTTASAQGAFTVHGLQKRVAQLTVERQRLEEAVALDDSPLTLAARARAMGLVQSSVPAFVRLSDGAVLGHPTPAAAVPHPAPGAAVVARVGAPGLVAAASAHASVAAHRQTTAAAASARHAIPSTVPPAAAHPVSANQARRHPVSPHPVSAQPAPARRGAPVAPSQPTRRRKP